MLAFLAVFAVSYVLIRFVALSQKVARDTRTMITFIADIMTVFAWGVWTISETDDSIYGGFVIVIMIFAFVAASMAALNAPTADETREMLNAVVRAQAELNQTRLTISNVRNDESLTHQERILKAGRLARQAVQSVNDIESELKDIREAHAV